MLAPADLFDLSQTEHDALFEGAQFAWDALKRLGSYLKENVRPELRNRFDGVAMVGQNVQIGEGTVLEHGVVIQGPAIIGKNCQIRHNAYLRENVLIGDGCVVGNACELKHTWLFNHAQVPHLNYVGDSILGHRAHLGAGVKISNVKLMRGNVMVEVDGKRFDTGLRKFGALIGDHTDIGCNAVLNPGSIIGRNCVLYPNLNWRGVLPSNTIAKFKTPVELIRKEPRNS